MPDRRTNQKVAERLELRLERCPNPLHRRRRWATLIAGLLPLLFLGVCLARRDHTIFWSEPVATSHQHLRNDCQACHREPWQPLVRMVSVDSATRSVRDEDCQRCHEQRKSDHHPQAMAKGVPDCVVCHQEHRGTIRLTEDADASCVKCHEPFGNHPEFALLRAWQLDVAPSAGAATKMQQLEMVATLQPTPDDPTRGMWRDKTALKFSHASHLAPRLARLERGGDATSLRTTEILACNDCHELDATGYSMRPIVYEQHCQECHPLRFSRKLDVAGALDAQNRVHDLPHATPEIVRSVMRQRLIANAPAYLNNALAPATRANSRLPNQRQTPAQAEWEWVARELQILENAIFRLPAQNATASSTNACFKCHESASSISDVDAPTAESSNSKTPPADRTTFAIAPPRIPSRWMRASHFRHDRHLNMKCIDCHHIPGVATGVVDDEEHAALAGRQAVQEILLPPQETCHGCHGQTQGAHPHFRPARKNCIECHAYHHTRIPKAAHDPATE